MGKDIAVIGIVAIIAATAVKIIKDKNKKYTNVDYDPGDFTGQDE